MSSPSPYRDPAQTADVAGAIGVEREHGRSRVHVTVIVQNRHTLDAGPTTGKHIKEMANVPAGFVLHRRAKGGIEPITDDSVLEPRNGDHFFARSPSTAHTDP